MAENYALMGTAISIMFNIVIIGYLAFTGTGKYAFKRLYNRMKVKKGKFVNTIFITKNGIIKEECLPVDEKGSFNYKGNKYTRNPGLLRSYFDTPTYVHLEGMPMPHNPFNDKMQDKISCNELDIVMNAENNFDIKLLFEKYKLLILIFFFIIIIGVVVTCWFGFNNHSLLEAGIQCKAAIDNSVAIKPL